MVNGGDLEDSDSVAHRQAMIHDSRIGSFKQLVPVINGKLVEPEHSHFFERLQFQSHQECSCSTKGKSSSHLIESLESAIQ